MEAHRPHRSEEESPLSNGEQQEIAAESAPESPQNLSFAESTLAAKALERRPVAPADRAPKAAGAGELVERQYEARHEIKDRPAAQQPVSVGNILAKLPAPAMSQVSDDPPSPMPLQASVVKDESTDNTTGVGVSIYRQAIRAGFIAAVIVILFFLILLLLT